MNKASHNISTVKFAISKQSCRSGIILLQIVKLSVADPGPDLDPDTGLKNSLFLSSKNALLFSFHYPYMLQKQKHCFCASVVDPNTFNLDPDPGFWPNLDPDRIQG